MPGCRDQSSICKDCCHLLIAGESVTPPLFLQIISNPVSDEDFNCQVRLPACEILYGHVSPIKKKTADGLWLGSGFSNVFLFRLDWLPAPWAHARTQDFLIDFFSAFLAQDLDHAPPGPAISIHAKNLPGLYPKFDMKMIKHGGINGCWAQNSPQI